PLRKSPGMPASSTLHKPCHHERIEGSRVGPATRRSAPPARRESPEPAGHCLRLRSGGQRTGDGGGSTVAGSGIPRNFVKSRDALTRTRLRANILESPGLPRADHVCLVDRASPSARRTPRTKEKTRKGSSEA